MIGKKIGMTSIYDSKGHKKACTIIEGGPCVVTQLRSIDVDGYEAIQLAYDDKKEKNTTRSLLGHFKKGGVSPKKKLIEFKRGADFGTNVKLGQVIRIEDIFVEGDYVDVVGASKGKGFQGVVKRHGFSGVGERTHGQKDRQRSPGSIGACSTPSRVFKGMRMGGRAGGERIKVLNLQVMKIIPDKNIIVVNGAVPGASNSYIILEK